MSKKCPQLPLTGGCQCGALRYSVTQSPKTLYCCHCAECQKQAASAFGMSLRVSEEAIEIRGDYSSYYRDESAPTAVECVFCSKCGTRVMHRGRGAESGSSIKAGTLDDISWLHPVGHVWTRSAQSWLDLDGLLFPGQPDDNYQALIDAFSRQQERP